MQWGSVIMCFLVLSLLLGCEQQVPESIEKKSRVAAMTLTDLQGVERRLIDYRGKWVIVNYWASWCPPCLEEIPELVQFHNEHKDRDAVVWGINREDISQANLNAFIKKQNISYPVFQVSPDSDSALGPVLTIPTTYLVSPKGEIIARHLGFVTVKKLKDFIQNYAGK